MTRRIVYGVALLVSIACTAMTISSIALPRWISYRPSGHREFSYGLHSRCTASGTCSPFPRGADCHPGSSFCNMWRTVGFLVTFSVVIELCALVSLVVIVSGGVQRRVAGWGVGASLLGFAALTQAAGMSVVAYVFEHDEKFWEGWALDSSFGLCTASWCILGLGAVGIAASAVCLGAENEYEVIPEACEPDDQLLSRIAAWDNGYKGIGYQYSNDPPERDPDMMSIASAQSRLSMQSRR